MLEVNTSGENIKVNEIIFGKFLTVLIVYVQVPEYQ